MCHLHLKLCTPPYGTVLYALPELLGILGFKIHHKTERNAAHNTDQQIFREKARQRIGKQIIQPVHGCHHLIGSITPRRYTPQSRYLVTKIPCKNIREIHKNELLFIHASGLSLQRFGNGF